VREKVFKEEIKRKLIEKAREADILIISDYAKGAITSDLLDILEEFKQKMIVDPKPSNRFLKEDSLKNVFLITPNEKESLEMSDCLDYNRAGETLRNRFNSNILITRGENGMALFSETKKEIPTFAREVYDVGGAGDTVVAALALALASNATLEEAAVIANHAAGIAVEKTGTYPVDLNELLNTISSENKKIVDLENLKRIVKDAKRKNKRIVWTNGCFDILHIGHIKYLKDAKKQGDILIVGIDSDDSVRRLKGPDRPVNPESERADFLASLGFIDYVTIFPFNSAKDYIYELKPDIYVNGGDRTLETINQEERKIVEDYGGRVYLGLYVPGKSTTNIVKKIKKDEAV
jgi:D-beta-D-heptose 7-phosphate kinase/D-beta-D-heptose 1-phosphate adenosyltransferase